MTTVSHQRTTVHAKYDEKVSYTPHSSKQRAKMAPSRTHTELIFRLKNIDITMLIEILNDKHIKNI